MTSCERFEGIQLEALLGEATRRERQQASLHARTCEPCREIAARDGALEAGFGVAAPAAEEGFDVAHRKLMAGFKECRAYCAQVKAPFGPVYLARSERGLCRISFRLTKREFLQELEEHQLLPEFEPARVAREARQLEEYFQGRSKGFNLPVDLRLVTPFQKRVLQAAARIPFGHVASYADVARRIGKPGARRAVGQALGRNPIAIVIPCHRVVAADGSIGGYTGGLEIKRTLLRLEGISFAEVRS